MNTYSDMIEQDRKLYELLKRIRHDYEVQLNYDDSYDLYHASELLRKRLGIIEP